MRIEGWHMQKNIWQKKGHIGRVLNVKSYLLSDGILFHSTKIQILIKVLIPELRLHNKASH